MSFSLFSLVSKALSKKKEKKKKRKKEKKKKKKTKNKKNKKTKKQMSQFVICLRVSENYENHENPKNPKNPEQKNPREHMTIAFCDTNKPEITQDIISQFSQLEKLDALVLKKDLLGENNDIPVILVAPEAEFAKVIFSLWKQFNVEQEHTKGLTAPNLHITIKENSPERKTGDLIKFDALFVKQVGKKDFDFIHLF